jgi:hypothetical protein
MSVTINGTTGLAGVDGSASTPALQGTDSNTGITFGTDTVNVVTGGTTRATVDSSGNVGIGTSSFTHPFTVKKSNAADWAAKFCNTAANGISGFGYYDNSDTWKGYVGYDNGDSNFLKLYAATSVGIKLLTSGAEAMRIDSSGNLLVGTTSNGNGSRAMFYKTGNIPTLELKQGDAGQYNLISNAFNNGGTYYHVAWQDGGLLHGSITSNGSSIAYNTTSDYRLKENVQPMQNALGVVAQLNPVTYTWKADGSDGEGFIAHELAEVVPQCVTGEKDEIEIYTDDEGNEQTRPRYQGIDTSFLVATLTAAIQEQQAMIQEQSATIASLTARIEALEAA